MIEIKLWRYKNKDMAYGLIPLIKNNIILAKITTFLEVFIYFYEDYSIVLCSNLVSEDNEEVIYSCKTSLQYAIEEYKRFIKESHIKKFFYKLIRVFMVNSSHNSYVI